MRGPKGLTGATGPTRAGSSWSLQASPSTTLDRWPRTFAGGWMSSLCGQVVIGSAIEFTKLSLQLVNGTPLSVAALTITLQKNGVDTSLFATLAAGASSTIATGSVMFAPGDVMSIKANQSTNEAQAQFWLYVFVSD